MYGSIPTKQPKVVGKGTSNKNKSVGTTTKNKVLKEISGSEKEKEKNVKANANSCNNSNRIEPKGKKIPGQSIENTLSASACSENYDDKILQDITSLTTNNISSSGKPYFDTRSSQLHSSQGALPLKPSPCSSKMVENKPYERSDSFEEEEGEEEEEINFDFQSESNRFLIHESFQNKGGKREDNIRISKGGPFPSSASGSSSSSSSKMNFNSNFDVDETGKNQYHNKESIGGITGKGYSGKHRFNRSQMLFARMTNRVQRAVRERKAFVSKNRKNMLQLAKWLYLSTFIALLIAVPLYSYDLYKNGVQKHHIAYFSSGALVLLTIPISMQDIHGHLTHWVWPDVQKYVVRILWMVPIYSVESWFSLRFKEKAVYIETLRECYEAYVIYCFLYFLIALLGGDEEHICNLLKGKPAERGIHIKPLSYFCKPWALGSEFLMKCKLGVLQYVLVKNSIAVVTMLLEMSGNYRDGDFSFSAGYLYITFINNCSQMWAIYCMILFYFATSEELTPWRPVGKFLCVKSVVFFTWWQSIIITLSYYAGWIRANNNMVKSIVEEDTKVSNVEIDGVTYKITEVWSGEEIAKGVQNYLICVEMLVAAIAHRYSFTYKDYKYINTRPIVTSFGEKLTPPVDNTTTIATTNYGEQGYTAGNNNDNLDKENDNNYTTPTTKQTSYFMSQNSNNKNKKNYYEAHSSSAGNNLSEEEEESMPFMSAFIESTIPKDFIRDLDILRKGAYSLAKSGVSMANKSYQNYYGEGTSNECSVKKPTKSAGGNPYSNSFASSSTRGSSAYGSTNLDVEMADVNSIEIDI